MASIIDNRNKTMLDSLKNSLKQAERVDILTAFFYFSGFNALAEDLKDKKIRILLRILILTVPLPIGKYKKSFI